MRTPSWEDRHRASSYCVLIALYTGFYRDDYSKGRLRILGNSWRYGEGKFVLKMPSLIEKADPNI